MYRLALRTLRLRTGAFVATFIAIFVGALVVMACGGLMETGIRHNVPAQRLAAAPIVVAGDQHYVLTSGQDTTTLSERVAVDPALVGRIAALPGVAAAVPDVSFPATLLRGDRPLPGDSYGHAWTSARLAPYSLDGAPPRHPGDVVLDRSLASGVRPGEEVRLLVHGKAQRFRVTGIATAPGPTTDAAVFFAAAPGPIDAIGVLPRPGADLTTLRHEVARVVAGHGAVALAGADRGVAEFPDVNRSAADLVVISAVFGGMAAGVALFVVASTLSLAARQRQRELALLRTLGATPRQVRRMILGEAFVVAVLAAAAAIVPARIFGGWLYHRLTGQGLIPPVVTHYQGWIPLLAGLGAALLTTVGAAFVAGRRAGRIRPVQALVEAELDRHWFGPVRALTAAIFIGGGATLSAITMTVLHGPVAASTAGPSVLCWAIGLALLGPALTRLILAVLRWPTRALTGLGGYLAVLNLRARAVPMASAVMPLMLATGIATANLYLQTTTVHEAHRAYTASVRADAVVSAPGGVSPDLVDRIRRTPGVVAAGAYAASTGVIDAPHGPQDSDGTPLQGISGSAGTISVPVRAGRLADLRGDTVALPVSTGRTLHQGVGGHITLRFGDRAAVRLRVVALFHTKPGYGTILLPVDLLARHTTTGLPTQILVRTAGHRMPPQLSTVVSSWPGVRLAPRSVLIADYDAGQRTQAWVNYLLIGMIVAYTAIAVANTLIAATGRRRREFGLTRLGGATRGLVLRMMGIEGLLVAAAGIALGTVVAILTLSPFCLTLTGSPFPSGPLWIYLVVVGAAAGLTLVSTLVPACAALRSRATEAAAE